jgi:head-tail adaptor
MNAGRMRDRITITLPAASLDAAGQRTPGETSVSVWADVSPVRINESPGGPRASAVLAMAAVQATIRYRDVPSTATVAWDGRTWAVVGQDWDRRMTSLTLYLKAR